MKQVVTKLGLALAVFATTTVSTAASYAEIPKYKDVENMLNSELRCLAENVYHEARSESITGQVAVAYVTLNRVFSDNFPNDICGVVKQGPVKESWKQNGKFYPIRYRCQFSWWCDGKSDKIYDARAWDLAMRVSWHVVNEYLSNRTYDPSFGATFYHADYVQPSWSKKFHRTNKIGKHIFYRENK